MCEDAVLYILHEGETAVESYRAFYGLDNQESTVYNHLKKRLESEPLTKQPAPEDTKPTGQKITEISTW